MYWTLELASKLEDAPWPATKDIRYRDAFLQGVEYLLSGQYENGGWPQF